MNKYKIIEFNRGYATFELSYISEFENIRKIKNLYIDETEVDKFIEFLKDLNFEEVEDE